MKQLGTRFLNEKGERAKRVWSARSEKAVSGGPWGRGYSGSNRHRLSLSLVPPSLMERPGRKLVAKS